MLLQINLFTICGSTHHAIQNTATFLEYIQTTSLCCCLQNPSKDCLPSCEVNLRQTKSARSLNRYFRARKNWHLFHVWTTCYQSTATKQQLKAQNQVKKIGRSKSKFIKKSTKLKTGVYRSQSLFIQILMARDALSSELRVEYCIILCKDSWHCITNSLQTKNNLVKGDNVAECLGYGIWIPGYPEIRPALTTSWEFVLGGRL